MQIWNNQWQLRYLALEIASVRLLFRLLVSLPVRLSVSSLSFLIGLALGQSTRPRLGSKPITKFTLRHHHPPPHKLFKGLQAQQGAKTWHSASSMIKDQGNRIELPSPHLPLALLTLLCMGGPTLTQNLNLLLATFEQDFKRGFVQATFAFQTFTTQIF